MKDLLLLPLQTVEADRNVQIDWIGATAILNSEGEAIAVCKDLYVAERFIQGANIEEQAESLAW